MRKRDEPEVMCLRFCEEFVYTLCMYINSVSAMLMNVSSSSHIGAFEVCAID